MKQRVALLASGLALALACLACGGSKAKPPVGVNAPANEPSIAPKGPLVSVFAYDIATVGEKSIGPFWVRRGQVGMAAYVELPPEGTRRVVSVTIDAAGNTKGDPHVIAHVVADTSTLIVRPTGGTAPGFVAAWTALTDRGESLSVVGIADDGTPRGTATELSHSVDDIVWMDILPTARGAVCVWAEETRGRDANILAVALDPDGKMRGVPSRVARGVTSWQSVTFGAGVALALVSPEDTSLAAPVKRGSSGSSSSSARRRERGSQNVGTLTWLRLDTDARPMGPSVAVTNKPSVSGDIDVVRLGDRSFLAWTDRTGTDPQVSTCIIGDDGKIELPRHPFEKTSGSSLVGLAAGASGAVLAWDEPNKRGRATRNVHLDHVTLDGTLDGKATTLEVQGRGAPEIVSTTSGFALLASAHVCEESAPAAAKSAENTVNCTDIPIVPTFMRLDASFALTQTEPLLLGEDRTPAGMAWGLSCSADRCSALTASGDPARVQSVDLVPRTTRYVAPLVASPPSDAPRLVTVATLASGESFADIAVAKVQETTLVATITTAIEGATPKSTRASAKATDADAKNIGATLSVRALDAKGVQEGAAVTLSTRALSVGGVAIAPGKTAEDGAAVAWVARENGDPQVHVTRVDKRGRRMNDVQLTIAKGDAADVAIAWAGDGWLVAWVDWRTGNGEVFATKVTTDLRRTAREERITDAPGDASDVTLLARGDRAWLSWSDPRESPQDGFADVYIASIRAYDAKRGTEEIRLLASAAHSRSPSLAPSGSEGVVVGWIEEAPMGADAAKTSAYGAMIATLDGQGQLREPPLRIRSAGDGFATAMALDPSSADTDVRAIVARASKDEMTLDTLELGGLSTARVFPLLTLDGPPSMDVAVAVMGGIAYFNDDGPTGGSRRARRAIVQWSH